MPALLNIIPGLSFGAPLVLAALIVLPAIWWLLRVTPPAARRIVFPPFRLLLGLEDLEETPAHTPWWIIVLRLLAAALAILALAEPIIGAAPVAGHQGPLVLFIDHGWTAAHASTLRQSAIDDALTEAARANRPMAIVTTSDPRANRGLLDAGTAGRVAREIAPVPYLPDRLAAAKALQRIHFGTRPEIRWLSDGIEDNGRATADVLARTGELRIFSDPSGKSPLALRPPAAESNGFSVEIIRPEFAGPRTGTVAALGSRGESLAEAHFAFADGTDSAHAHILLPLEVRNESAELSLGNENSAGATDVLDQGAAIRAVGIVSATAQESAQPLLSDLFYLERALGPYADVHTGTISGLLAQNPAVLILADVGRVAGRDHDREAA